ncbi:hypothetical protein JW926_14825 [Candidatus Sumerlaeota bacterium]|nr:hypothetical protein [Candidatus Sumerlaeota bacterium]
MMSEKNHDISIRETWIEQKGGLILSIFFHLALFSFLITKYPEYALSAKIPRSLSLLLNLTRESDEKEAISFNPAASTFQDEKQREEPSSQEQEEVREKSVEKLIYSRERPLPEFRTGIEEMEQELEVSLADLQKAIERRSVNVKGTRTDFDSSGADEGTVRILDIGKTSVKTSVAEKKEEDECDSCEKEATPERIAEQVLQKYHIRITQKFISGDNNVFFLNKVEVQGKTFVSGNASGYYEVFEIPLEAVRKMTLLENLEFHKRKLDPSRTRVKKIVFGIVKINGEYDLGITKFEYEEIN